MSPAHSPASASAQRLELLFVTGTFPQLSETFIYRKAVMLARRGHQVTVLCRAQGSWEHFPEPLPEQLRVTVMPPDSALRSPRRALALVLDTARTAGRSPIAARALYERCHEDARTRHDALRQFVRHLPLLGRRADALHFEFVGSGAMYPLAGELVDAPIVVSCRGSDIHLLELQPEPVRVAQLACLRSATAVHCVSDEIARHVRRLAGERDGVWINRPAVDTGAIVSRRLRPTRLPLEIIAVGRLTWKKGFDYLLAALGLLARRGISFHATIVGTGELLGSFRFTVGDLKLQRHVDLAGALAPSEVLRRMQSADVFVLPSLDEGISNAALEAMASAVPVVSSTVGGMPEAIRDGVEGLLVPVRDAGAIADALERLARDRDLAERLGLAARRRAVAEFDVARQTETFERLYRSLGRGAG